MTRIYPPVETWEQLEQRGIKHPDDLRTQALT